MSLAAMPPAVVKSPPAYKLLPDTASAYTESRLSIPEPSASNCSRSIWRCYWPRAACRREIAPAYTLLPDTASAYT